MDVEQQFVVMGTIIDKEENGFVMYVEISKATGGEQAEMVTRIESFRGKTLFDATRNGIQKMGAKPYWGHATVFIVSEKVAEEGLAEVLSFLKMHTEIRTDIFILVCKNKDVKKILTFDDPLHEDVSGHLHDLIESYEASSKIRKAPLFIVLQEVASSEMSLMLSIIKMEKAKVEQKDAASDPSSQSSAGKDSGDGLKDIIVCDGSAIFIADRMTGTLDEIETRSALILKKNITKNYVLTVEESKDTPAFSIEVISSKLSINPNAIGTDKLNFEIKLEIKGDLVELISEEDYMTEERKGELEMPMEEQLEKELKALILKSQETGSDICGFAGVTHRKLAEFWKNMNVPWSEIFAKSTFNISVNIDITNSSLSLNPTKVGI